MTKLDMTVEPNVLDSVATCHWYISIVQPECGRDAPYKLTIKGKIVKATIDVCEEHKALHDRNFAKLRADKRLA